MYAWFVGLYSAHIFSGVWVVYTHTREKLMGKNIKYEFSHMMTADSSVQDTRGH